MRTHKTLKFYFFEEIGFVKHRIWKPDQILCQVRGSLARRALIELMEKGLIKQVNFNCKRTSESEYNTMFFRWWLTAPR